MLLSGFEEENFANYKKPSMTIGFPSCTFKCGKWCQNYNLASSKRVTIDDARLVQRYVNNPITHAIICAGLDPFDSYEMLVHLIEAFRKATDDDIVVYTGYDEDEVIELVNGLRRFDNIIVKFGRYIPDGTPIFDDVLGIELVSSNQYAVRIS